MRLRHLLSSVPLPIIVLSSSLVLSLVAGSYAQSPENTSLGDLARRQRHRQQPKNGASKKVVTNEDIPEHPQESPDFPVRWEFIGRRWSS